MTRPKIVLPPLAAPVDALWHLLLDLQELLSVRWSVVGGQMVLLHALEHGQVPPQISQDADVIADVRADPEALGAVVAALASLGFRSAGITTDGRSHRFEKSAEPTLLVIDVLAPEGLGPRADLTTEPPGRTIEVPGGTQALSRTELVDIEHEGRIGCVPRPALIGAIVAKSAASGLAGDVARHLRDLALLCALVEDPFAMRSVMSPKDRQRIRLAAVLQDRGHMAWQLVPGPIREQAFDAFGILRQEG